MVATICSDLLSASERLRALQLDVTKPRSIARAFELIGAIIDILVNNPDIGLFGAVEATQMATAREVFKTNTFRVIAMCKRSS